MVYREELISYYKQLSDAAELRTAKARWRVRRHRLDGKRSELLQSAAGRTLSADDVTHEVLWRYHSLSISWCKVSSKSSENCDHRTGHRQTETHRKSDFIICPMLCNSSGTDNDKKSR